MFGLMKNTGCLRSDQRDWYRMHYCGTCKAIGSLYGQRSRMLLNFDCVFLAELLSVIQEANTTQWHPKLSGYNCFSIPKSDELPTSLQYAADINLILAEMKVRDNLQDGDGLQFVWEGAQRFLRKPFSKVGERLARWGIDQQSLLAYQEEDAKRETEVPGTDEIAPLLDWHAAPTAAITSYLFAKGADAVQKPAWRETMADIGAAFGELVYGLDAWKDVEKDQEEGAFNLLLLHPERSLEDGKQLTADWLWEKADEIQDLVGRAEFPADVKQSLNARLMLNLATALGDAPEVCTPSNGIQKSTLPTFARGLHRLQRGVGAWVNPLKPARFAATYIALMFVIFHQQLWGAAEYGAETSLSIDYTLLGVLVAAPVGVYMAARGIAKHRFWLAWKLKRQQRKLNRRLQDPERKPPKKKRRLKVEEILVICGFTGLIGCLACSCACNKTCDACTDECDTCRSSGCGEYLCSPCSG
jgi:hypothetical protein